MHVLDSFFLSVRTLMPSWKKQSHARSIGSSGKEAVNRLRNHG